MRVLIVTHWFPPILSGSSYYASSLAHALVERGHEVRVVTFDWKEANREDGSYPFPVERLPVIRLPKMPLFYKMDFMGLSFTPGNIRRLGQIIARERPHILHHVNHIFDSTFLSLAAARKARVPIVGSITTPIQHQTPWKQKLMEGADRLTVGTFGVSQWDGIVSLDRSAHDYVGKCYGKKAQARSAIIPFGVRLESLAEYRKMSVERAGPPQILFVGHIHPFRNPVMLIRAMPEILKAVPDARLVLAGRMDLDEPRKTAESLGLTPERVRFLGETRHEETIRLLGQARVFASWVTGPYPGLGTAPMEAMLCQTPVVNDLPEDLFGDGKLKNWRNIVLTDSKDPGAIAQAAIRLLQNEDLRRRIGAAGREFVAEHLSWEGITRQLEFFYEKVISGRGVSLKNDACTGSALSPAGKL